MGRIRLQVQIMPHQGLGQATFNAQTRQNDILKWCEPCSGDFTIQRLVDEILATWASVYVGYGSLNIKELTTVYGERLHMRKTVEAYFDDRNDTDNKIPLGEVPPTSIVQVHRYPPHPSEIPNVQRFGSLLPESAARPRKRPLTISSQGPPDSLRAAASIEGGDNMHPSGNFTSSSKRQRTHDAFTIGAPYFENAAISREGQTDERPHTSQMSGTQGSIHQVYDSQPSHANKPPVPYGTPTSLSHNISPQEPDAGHLVDITSIPDSPISRRASFVDHAFGSTINLDRDREATKSESPEIESSFDGLPATEDQSSTHPTAAALNVPEQTVTRRAFSPRTRSTLLQEPEHRSSDDNSHGSAQDVQLPIDEPRSFSFCIRSPFDKLSGQRQKGHGSWRHSEEVYDDIESDTESFKENQRTRSAERRRLGPATSERAPLLDTSSSVRRDRNDERFKVPSLPIPRANRSRQPSSVSEGMQTRGDGNSPNDSRQYARAHGDDAEEGPSVQDSAEINRVQPDPEETHESSPKHHLNSGAASEDKRLELNNDSYQATIAGAQSLEVPPKNLFHLPIDHPCKQALSKGQRPNYSLDLTSRQDANANSNYRKSSVHRSSPPAARPNFYGPSQSLACNMVDEQQIATEDAQEPYEAGRVAEQTSQVADQAAKSESVARDLQVDKETQKAVNGDVAQLAEAERVTRAKTKEKEQRDAEEKASKEAKAEEKRAAELKKREVKALRERQAKEKALSDEAENLKLEADGAKQLEVERRQKQRTPAPAKLKAPARETPKPAKNVRTPAEKERRRQREAAQRAEKAKATGANTTQVKTTKAKIPQAKTTEARITQAMQPLTNKDWTGHFQNGKSTEVQASSEHKVTGQGDNRAAKKADTPTLSQQELQQVKDASKDRSRHSDTPESRTALSRSRKSLTPALPMSVTKSSSFRGDAMSSSPLASRSSSRLETPLRSALKHTDTSSGLRRSVSFMTDQGPSLPDHRKHSFSSLATKPSDDAARPVRSLVELNNDLALPKPPPSKSRATTPAASATKSSIKEKAAPKIGKAQQKLNVVVDKKMKGRAVDPPVVPAKPSPKQEIVLSSGDDDSDDWISDEENTSEAHAGPSSRKSTPRANSVSQDPKIRVNPLGIPIDPAFDNVKNLYGGATPLELIRRRASESSATQKPSHPQSPAKSVTETISLSSGVSSSSESSSGSESGSVEEIESPSAMASSNAMHISQTVTKTNDDNSHLNLDPEILNSSQASKSAERTSYSSDSHGSDGAADPSSQLSSQKPVPANPALPIQPPATGAAKYDHLLNQGLNRHGRLPNGTRPAYYKYPKLSVLKKVAEADTAEEEARIMAKASQSSAVKEHQFSSSSSEHSSSDSDDDEDEVEGAVSPTSSRRSSKSRSGMFPGLKGVLKLANKIRPFGQKWE